MIQLIVLWFLVQDVSKISSGSVVLRHQEEEIRNFIEENLCWRLVDEKEIDEIIQSMEFDIDYFSITGLASQVFHQRHEENLFNIIGNSTMGTIYKRYCLIYSLYLY